MEKENTNLRTLFMQIDEYAKENFIYPTVTEQGCYYIIYYNNDYYKLYLSALQGTYFYLKKAEKTEEAIDYKDVIENKPRTNKDLIKFKLNQLRLIVSELSNIMPEEEIKKEVTIIYKK